MTIPGAKADPRASEFVISFVYPQEQSTEDAVSVGLIEIRSDGERYAINPALLRYISEETDGRSYLSFGENHGLTLAIPYVELFGQINNRTKQDPDIIPVSRARQC